MRQLRRQDTEAGTPEEEEVEEHTPDPGVAQAERRQWVEGSRCDALAAAQRSSARLGPCSDPP